ncbi:hypothetical protein PybrP1_006874 [[Pythium] brassicae (nom. inval.)]|nr:hypothetical protein PybrP1_006874 [[Pythium] brassicae (nom. inval.)]
MTREEKQVSLTTAFLILTVADTAERRRGKGIRNRFAYYLPLLGEVCRDAFCAVYEISTPTFAAYRNRIARGDIDPARHGFAKNTNAARIGDDRVAAWFHRMAGVIGEVVPLRVQRVHKVNGVVVKRVSKIDHILLPAYYTWEDLYKHMLDRDDKPPSERLPSMRSFRRALTELCPTIKIHSPRDHICDDCVLMKNAMSRSNTAMMAEQLGFHATRARAMRDVVSATRDAAVSFLCASLERDDFAFSDYKSVVTQVYNNVKGIQKYNTFTTRSSIPGVVVCQRTPDSPPNVFDIRKAAAGKRLGKEAILDLYDNAADLPPPPLHAEKLQHIHQNLHPYVPIEYTDDPMYHELTAEEESAARSIRKSRLAANE